MFPNLAPSDAVRYRFSDMGIDPTTGRKSDPTVEQSPFCPSVRPANTDEIQTLPEGDRDKRAIVVRSCSLDLRITSSRDQTRADWIEIPSGPFAGFWEVRRVANNSTGIVLPHWKAICTVQQPTEVP